jgi:hypothetical protein
MAYNVGIDAPQAGLVGVNFVLNMIGFKLAAERVDIMDAGLNQFEAVRYLTEKDIRDMADNFAKRTIADRRFVFGFGRTKKLIGVMHWIRDCYRADNVPDHGNLDMAVLYEALSLAQIRKLDIELVTANTKAADQKRIISFESVSHGKEIHGRPGVAAIHSRLQSTRNTNV